LLHPATWATSSTWPFLHEGRKPVAVITTLPLPLPLPERIRKKFHVAPLNEPILILSGATPME